MSVAPEARSAKNAYEEESHVNGRIEVNAWGRGDWSEPEYATLAEDVPASRCVAEAIARESGLEIVMGRVYPDGYNVDGGRVVSRQYRFNLGTRVDGGGWYPEAEIWFTVDAKYDGTETPESLGRGARRAGRSVRRSGESAFR